ncbi:gem-associated protein 6 isoform X2 [Sus scrofa]|nr:gem-associated protein 6 isoform X2 [Sus scrofa]XP_013851649.1 gem-associated protein 6 isoform X2 [Sus scrofa]XP_013851650.1 gem-associated protein 6 isoform X2 [Sus scrofa]XP_013851651.1 gem-associated protein 6 isoform X2 [Sus scrofa]
MNEWMKKGPLEWQDYTYKEVRVTASEKEYKGWVLTTDPVSAKFFFCNYALNLLFLQSIVLVNFLEDGSMSVTGIMGHGVQTVEIVNEGDHNVREKLMHLFMSGDCKAYSPEDLEERKNSLKKWLEKNHIPITEQGDSRRTLCVAGVLTIDPPYGPENCSSSNEIILSRVQDLIQGHLAASH